MAETKAVKSEKKKTSPLVYIGIGCVILIILISLGSAIVGKFFAKKAAEGFIESKTGIKTNIKDLEEGKMTFTDKETGTKVDIGGGKVPDNFPKDFPLYPGAKVSSALSGSEAGNNNGFWLTMETGDALDKVVSFYKSQLETSGWTTTGTYASGDTTNYAVEKGTWSGSVAATRASDDKETSIVIILGEEEK